MSFNQNIYCSVIICTYNRADSLGETINALAGQDFSADEFEIIVVDNNSTDNTKQVVNGFSENKINIRYFFEGEQGLSKARNTGLKLAAGKIVLFTDDDALPHKNWLANIVEAYNDSGVWAAGGDVFPVWPEKSAPEWLHRALYKFLGLTAFSFPQKTTLHYPEYPYGVNISFRRNKIIDLGGFADNLGRCGELLLSGEEIEMCRRVESAGGKVVYVPNALVQHKISHYRVCKAWFRKRSDIQGVSKAKIELDGISPVKKIGYLAKRLPILAGSAVSMVIFSLLGLQKLAFMSECKMRMSWGYFAQALSLKE